MPRRSCPTARRVDSGGWILCKLPALEGLALMGRPQRGTLKRRPAKQGISYGVAFTYRGEEFYVHSAASGTAGTKSAPRRSSGF